MQNGGFVNKIQGVRLSVAKIHRHVFENPGCWDYNGKRHKYVTLTEKGEEFSKKTVDLDLAEEIAAFEDMDASERELAMKLLAKYSDNLSRRMSKFR